MIWLIIVLPDAEPRTNKLAASALQPYAIWTPGLRIVHREGCVAQPAKYCKALFSLVRKAFLVNQVECLGGLDIFD